MASQLKFECQVCRHIEQKWLGRCPECGNWNSFSEFHASGSKQKKAGTKDVKIPLPISSIEFTEEIRFDSGNDEINRVLGGGIVKGSTIIVAGEPGIGKSTLMLQFADSVNSKGRVLYISGEESINQIKLRAQRLSINSNKIEVFCETNLYEIKRSIENLKPVIVIIDSIQTLNSGDPGAISGTINQVKLCASELSDLVKDKGIALFLVGHVTKDGLIAGPKVVEHMVDTVLYFDQAGADIRILRAVKNRFGSTDEIGLFTMNETGLVQMKDPASVFLEHRDGTPPPGVSVAPVYEGSRVLLVEIQSLVVPAKGGISRVFSDKIDSRRISRLSAVLEKHLKMPFGDVDIYVNIAGGLKVTEVGIDLPVCLSLYSARQNLALPANIVIMGEVSLAGEVRMIPKMETRIKTSLEMGFHGIAGPPVKAGEQFAGYYPVSNIQQAIKTVFSL